MSRAKELLNKHDPRNYGEYSNGDYLDMYQLALELENEWKQAERIYSKVNKKSVRNKTIEDVKGVVEKVMLDFDWEGEANKALNGVLTELKAWKQNHLKYWGGQIERKTIKDVKKYLNKKIQIYADSQILEDEIKRHKLIDVLELFKKLKI